MNTDPSPMEFETIRVPNATAERNRKRLEADRVLSPAMTWADHLFADVTPAGLTEALSTAIDEIKAAVVRATEGWDPDVAERAILAARPGAPAEDTEEAGSAGPADTHDGD